MFPERPGALMRFLSSMHPNWNISLFHYRNQGADYGRVLVGLQDPAGRRRRLPGRSSTRWPTRTWTRPTTRCTGSSSADAEKNPASLPSLSEPRLYFSKAGWASTLKGLPFVRKTYKLF